MNLIDFEIILSIAAITCSLQFLILLIAKKTCEKIVSVIHITLLEKFIIFFLLIPTIYIIFIVIKHNVNVIPVSGADISVWKIIEYENFNTTNQNSMTIEILIFIFWFIGFCIRFLWINIKDKRVLSKLHNASTIIDCKDKLFLMKENLTSELNISREIGLYRCAHIDSPFIVGIIKPHIYLPITDYSEEIFELMLKHELYHYKNKDLIFRKLAVLIEGIYWFNPFTHYFIKIFFEDCEIASDTMTLYNVSVNMRSRYAHVILNIIRTQNNLSCASNFTSNVVSTKRRIVNIMKNKIDNFKLVTYILTFVVIAMCPLTAYASAGSAAAIQDKYTRLLFDQRSAEENDYYFETDTEKYIYENTNSFELVNLYTTTRGVNSIDCVVNSKTRVIAESISLKKGDTVQFILASTKDSDSFRAGITDSNGNSRYVNSSNGTLSYTFTISAAGTYDLYIQGNTSADAHITGAITL